MVNEATAPSDFAKNIILAIVHKVLSGAKMYTLAEVQAIIWSLWALALLTTIARVILRWRVQHKFHGDDHFAFASFVFLTGLVGVVATTTSKFDVTRRYLLAAAKDPLTPPPLSQEEMTKQTVLSLKLMFAQMLLFWSTLWAGKFSLLTFFRTMVLGLPKYIRIWWMVFTLVLLTYLACMLSNFLTCRPLTKYWGPTGCSAPEDLRRSDVSIKFATAADVFADFLIMLLPLRLLFSLQKIPMKQKAGIACLFSLGTIVIIFAFVRLFNVTKATAASQIDPTTLLNAPILLSTWSTIEAAVGTIVANLPAFRSLLTHRGQTRLEVGSGTPGGNSGYNRGTSFKTSGSRSAIIDRGSELESLHSFDGEVGKGRGRAEAFEAGDEAIPAGDIVITRHLSVESRKRMEGEVENQRSKLGLKMKH